ncbi:hypothetical protein WA158_002535 [Blastocystis sp. Blastoise]
MESKSNKFITNYLVAYNAFCLVGWSYVLIKSCCIAFNPEVDFWAAISFPLKVCQTTALLEILHCLIRIVHSPVFSTFVQVFSRLAVLWGLANVSPDAQQFWGFKLMVISWSLVEPPRYLFYLFKLMDLEVPTWLLFLRYHLFIVLYPTGITGEISVLLKSLKYIKESQIWSVSLPNPWNFAFSYYYFVCCLLLIYIPGGPFMYNVMIKNREKNWVNRKPKSD